MNKTPLIYKGFVVYKDCAINYKTRIVLNNIYSNWNNFKKVIDQI